MALKLFVFVSLCVIAAAEDENAKIIWTGARRTLDCVLPGVEWLEARRSPPPPLEAQDHVQYKPYKWTLNGKEINDSRISKNGSLELLEDALPGIYQCSSHAGGVVLGYPYNLKTPYAKAIVADSNEVQARVGQPLAIDCFIDSYPLGNVSWQKYGKVLVEDSRIYILKKQLLISEVRSEDASLYTCTVTNPVLKKTITSNPVRVQVVESNDEVDPSFLDLKHEQDVVVEKGSRVELPCPVIAWPKVGMIWYWTKPGEVMDSELENTNEVLVLDNIQRDQEGIYTCSVENRKALAKKFNVMILEPPTIVIPPTDKAFPRASTVRFNCTVTGSPQPKITWYKDGRILSLTGETKLMKSADNKRIELVLSSVTSDDAGVYQCFARNPSGVATAAAALTVTGVGELPPAGLRCQPLSANTVALAWSHPNSKTIVAYTLSVTSVDSFDSKLALETKQNQTLKEALTPYTFEVKAYAKAAASDKSESITCQGQGVPIQLKKKEDNVVLVSWNVFAKENPGVVQWKLQYRDKPSGLEHNVTLDGAVTNYSIHASPAEPLEVRLLGSRSASWLPLDLRRLPWTSTAAARDGADNDDLYPVPSDLKATDISSHSFALSWRCDEAVNSPKRYMFYVCIKKLGHNGDSFCSESQRNTTRIEHVDADSEYEVKVQACLVDNNLKGPYSKPYTVRTLPEEVPKRSFYYSVLNATSALVWWRGAPARTEVKFASQLRLPLDAWNTTTVEGNNAVITINPSSPTYVTVLGLDSSNNTKILTIPTQVDGEVKDFQQVYTGAGVRVWWAGAAARYGVKYSQEIWRPVEQWVTLHVDEPSVELKNLNHSLPTYVMVTPALADSSPRMITIMPYDEESSSLYLGIGVGCGVLILVLLLVAALCIWRRRKRMRSPIRSRRRNVSGNESNDEEAAEMKNVGGRLANGGTSRGAGEPLLNGHVHITENPTPKTPNGKRPQRYDAAFDVSRYDEDTTQETVLDTDTTLYTTLDASRPTEYDTNRDSLNITANNSFNKLPDDNMNSELNLDSGYIDKGNSKLQPTLQPNG